MRLVIELELTHTAKRDEVDYAFREAASVAGKRVVEFGEPAPGNMCMLNVEASCVCMAVLKNVSKR